MNSQAKTMEKSVRCANTPLKRMEQRNRDPLVKSEQDGIVQ